MIKYLVFDEKNWEIFQIFWQISPNCGKKTHISQKNGYLGIRFIKRAVNFWNGGLLKKTEFVLSNEFWQHCISEIFHICFGDFLRACFAERPMHQPNLLGQQAHSPACHCRAHRALYQNSKQSKLTEKVGKKPRKNLKIKAIKKIKN